MRLKVSIEANGRVNDVVVVKSSGHTALDDAAREAVVKMRFSGGQPGTFLYSYEFVND